MAPSQLKPGLYGCCWETLYIFAYCGLVRDSHLYKAAELESLLPFQRQARLKLLMPHGFHPKIAL